MFSNRDLRKLIVPLAIEQTLVMAVGIVDTMMISHVGEAAISGVALVDMINYLIIIILAAIDTGGAVIVSQYLGRKDRENADKAAGQLLNVTTVSALGLMGLCMVFHNGILNLFFGAVDAEVKRAAVIYFVITAASFPFLGIYNSCTAIFRSMQRTNVTMMVSLLMNCINIVGNVIGIFVLHAGVAGVAVPTLIARAAGELIMLCMAFSSKNQVQVSWKKIISWDKEIIGKILHIAVPGGIENGLFTFGRILVTSIVALFGTSQIAANGVAYSLDQIALIIVNANNLAMVTVVGQCMGAGKPDEAARYTKKLMKISYLYTTALSLAVLILMPLILRFYRLSDDTYRLTCFLVITHNFLACLLHPTSFNLPNSLRAAGDVRITMYCGIGSMIIFRLGTAFLLGIVFHMGIYGVWVAMGMDWLARSVVFTLRYRKGKWREIHLI